MESSWTDARVARLKELHAEGLSASQIAANLGGVSRCAVISKVHRLGLGGRVRTAHAKSTSVATGKVGRIKHRVLRIGPAPGRGGHMRASFVPTLEIEPLRDLSPEAIPPEQRKTILTIRSNECRWPYGTPGTADFFLCGAPADPGPYCRGHRAIAWRPANSSERYATRLPPSEGFRFGSRKVTG